MSRTQADPLAVQRKIILGLLVFLTAAAWISLTWQAAGMNMPMVSPTMGMGPPLFLAIWIVMMVAMMFPTAAPMILTFHRVQGAKRRRGEAFVSTWVFVGAYILIWTLAGIAAYLGAAGAEALAERVGLSTPIIARIGGVILLLAGIYQFSPLKDVCLAKCRTPMTFIMTSWRDGTGGAIRMGIAHGIYCLGCCWLLFLILFPLGIMNVAAMALVTLLIFTEKTLPTGRSIARVAGVALAVYGITVLAVPEVLPTNGAGGSMPMSMSGSTHGMPGKENDAHGMHSRP